MKIAGIIAEYNPFHTGHAYHISTTCEKCAADYIVCVMSGNFTQRGEPAIADKWFRVRMALLGGASLVLELPFVYATQSAEGFAKGAVRLFNALHCVDILSFGAEDASLEILSSAADILVQESTVFKTRLKEALSEGNSFPLAREKALSSLLSSFDSSVLKKPNNILALEYLKALSQTKSSMIPFAVPRAGGGYSSNELNPVYSSARAIRNAIKLKNDAYKNYILQSTSFSDPVFSENMFPFLMFRLRSMKAEEIGQIYGVSEGLEYRIAKESKRARDYESLVHSIASKRYPYARIRRILLYCLFGITKKHMEILLAEPLYARILGVRRDCISLLSHLSASATIPLVTNTASFPNTNLFALDIRATEIYSLLAQKIAPGGRDFTQKFLVI